MREQVIFLPPFVERRQASCSLSKKEAAVLGSSRNWEVPVGENAEQLESFALIGRNQLEVVPVELGSAAENLNTHDAQEALGEPLRGACEEDVGQSNACAEGSLALERTEKCPSPNDEDAPLLRWGLVKGSRRSRSHHHRQLGNHRQVRNHSIEPNESSLLFHESVHVQANKAIAVQPNTSCHQSKGTMNAKNGVAAEIRKDLWSAGKNPTQKVKRSVSDAERCITGSPSRGVKRVCPSRYKQEQQLLQQSNTHILAAPKMPPKDRCPIPLPGRINAGPSKHEFVWPKLNIKLTRKEKEEDFLLIRGTKLPQRPKRRPKVVERARDFCTPGCWLTDISFSRYNVPEKKRARKKPRGLKAMQNLDSDSN